MTKTTQQLADYVGGTVLGDPKTTITSGSALDVAKPGQISFLANSKYSLLLTNTQASAVIVAERTETPSVQIVVDNPYYAFTQVLALLHGHRSHAEVGVHPQALIHPSAAIGGGSSVHERVTIAEGVRIGRRCVLYPGSYLGQDVELGDDCVLFPNVVIYEKCRLGHRVMVHANTTIGQDGLGFSTHEGVHYKIPHTARVILEDDVEIGANAGIERGTLQDTVVGSGSKIGSQVAVGHGVQVGPHCLIVAQTGIAGSTKLGHHCVLAGQVGVAGHLEIGNQVTIAGKSGVHQNIPDGERVFGMPAFDMDKAVEAYSLIKRLPELRRAVLRLEERLTALEDR